MGLTQDYADRPIESLTAKHDIIDTLLADLERDGAVTLPPLVSADTLAEMQAVFGRGAVTGQGAASIAGCY